MTVVIGPFSVIMHRSIVFRTYQRTHQDHDLYIYIEPTTSEGTNLSLMLSVKAQSTEVLAFKLDVCFMYDCGLFSESDRRRYDRGRDDVGGFPAQGILPRHRAQTLDFQEHSRQSSSCPLGSHEEKPPRRVRVECDEHDCSTLQINASH